MINVRGATPVYVAYTAFARRHRHFFGGIGFTVAIVIMAGIREELDHCDVPRPLRGAGITLIVAGILALLAAFAIPRLFSQAEQAKIDLGRAAVGRNGPIAKALKSYKWDMGAFPETDEGLQALFEKKDRGADERYKGPYLEGTYEELLGIYREVGREKGKAMIDALAFGF